MAFERRAVGLDLGTQTVRAVEVQVSDRGILVTQALQVARSELPGADQKQELARALRSLLAESHIDRKGVVFGLGGQDCMIRYTRVPPIPSWRLKVVMNYEVAEISEKMGEDLASDFRVLQLTREAGEDQTVLIAMAKEKPLGEMLDALEAEGITVERATPNPLSLFTLQEAFGWKPEPDSAEDDLLLIADMGAENLCILLVLNGRLAFARSVTFGGNNFTAALAETLRLDPIEAERVKISRGGLDERERGVLAEGARPLQMLAGQLFGLIQSSIQFSAGQIGARLPPLTRVALLGGGFRLRGLKTFLEKKIEKPVEFFAPMGLKLSPSLPEPVAQVLSERPSDFGVALGLGISGLRQAPADTAKAPLSILPARYVQKREFRDRTVFLYAAGALLVLLLVARLAHGIVLNWNAKSVHRELAAAHGELQKKKAELVETSRQADIRRTKLNRLLREAETTAFQAYVLDLLARTLRPEIQLEQVYLDCSALTEDETSPDYALHVSGKVSNEKRQGLNWILELQSALKAEERIRSVEVESSKPVGEWYSFELSLKPNYVNY